MHSRVTKGKLESRVGSLEG